MLAPGGWVARLMHIIKCKKAARKLAFELGASLEAVGESALLTPATPTSHTCAQMPLYYLNAIVFLLRHARHFLSR